MLDEIGRFLTEQGEQRKVDAACEDGVIVPFSVEFRVYLEHAASSNDYPVDDQLG